VENAHIYWGKKSAGKKSVRQESLKNAPNYSSAKFFHQMNVNRSVYTQYKCLSVYCIL
jgi:hypothetical protein